MVRVEMGDERQIDRAERDAELKQPDREAPSRIKHKPLATRLNQDRRAEAVRPRLRGASPKQRHGDRRSGLRSGDRCQPRGARQGRNRSSCCEAVQVGGREEAKAILNDTDWKTVATVDWARAEHASRSFGYCPARALSIDIPKPMLPRIKPTTRAI